MIFVFSASLFVFCFIVKYYMYRMYRISVSLFQTQSTRLVMRMACHFYILTKNVSGCLPMPHSTFSLVSFRFCCQFYMEKWHFLGLIFVSLIYGVVWTVIFIIHLYFFCKFSKEVLCPIVCWCVEFCLFPSKAFQIFQYFSYTYKYMYAYVGACYNIFVPV